jgi:hypothetical protein
MDYETFFVWKLIPYIWNTKYDVILSALSLLGKWYIVWHIVNLSFHTTLWLTPIQQHRDTLCTKKDMHSLGGR